MSGMSRTAFEQEWSSARSAAGTRAAAGPAVAGGVDLSVDGAELGAIGGAAYALYQRLTRDGDHARPATFDASLALTNTGFRSGRALLVVHDRWNTQLRTLLDACAQISNHLDHSAASHATQEADIVAALSASRIATYFA